MLIFAFNLVAAKTKQPPSAPGNLVALATVVILNSHPLLSPEKHQPHRVLLPVAREGGAGVCSVRGRLCKRSSGGHPSLDKKPDQMTRLIFLKESSWKS